MVPIKLSEPLKHYSADDLRTGLRLVVSNSQPVQASGKSSTSSAIRSKPLLDSHPDGERTQALTQLVGVYLAKGIAPDEVAQIASDWNLCNDPPIPAQVMRLM